MHPRDTAISDPGRPAVVMAGSGARLSYAQLVRDADRCAEFFRQLGLQAGDSVAICMENCLEYFPVCWAAFNSGLYFTPVSSRLKRDEIAYILSDCDARVVFVSASMLGEVAGLPTALSTVDAWVLVDGAPAAAPAGFQSYAETLATCSGRPFMAATQGAAMVYTSGTTGFPKGVRPPQSTDAPEQPPPLLGLLGRLYGFDGNTVYLSTGPLYHAAPLKFNLAVQTLGGTSIVMKKFDAEHSLKYIQQYGVSHSQWVPTMFTRLLRLPPETKKEFDLGSHRVAIHAAAPCPVEVKQHMLDWWGPMVHEYYAGSESIGMCAISPQDWLEHRGSVGRAVKGELHIVGVDGAELPKGETGLVCFGNGSAFTYHKDAGKTARAYLPNGWATFGDIGHVDEEGYLYLTDRRDYVIISGGVNIYPQEAENALSQHPEVADVAVFGIPDEEFGEAVKAVVKPLEPGRAGAEFERELIAYCKSRLASLKCPKTIDFIDEMPREPNGKLLKLVLQKRYQQPVPSKH